MQVETAVLIFILGSFIVGNIVGFLIGRFTAKLP